MILFFCNVILHVNLLTYDKYSNLLLLAAFSTKSFSSKTPWPFKNSYLPTFPDNKAKIFEGCLSKQY